MTNESNAQKLHSYASSYNWDNGSYNLRKVINDPDCDKGTALLIYWLSAPGYYCQFASRDEVPSFQVDNYDFVRELEEMYMSGKFKTANILFNPQWDKTTMSSGFNWTEEYKEHRQTKDISGLMKQPSIADPDWEKEKNK